MGQRCNSMQQICNKEYNKEVHQPYYALNIWNKIEAVRGSDATVRSRYAIKNTIKICINHMH